MRSTIHPRSLALCLTLLAGCIPLGGTTDGGGNEDGGATVQPRFSSLYSSYLSSCKNCHAPGAPGRTSDIEMTLDFSTATTAHTTLTTGKAAGLMGNHAGCNGAPFVTAGTPGSSLLVAALDQPTRQVFDTTFANCDETAIADMTVKVGTAPPSGFIAALKQWVTNGAANN